MSVRLQYAIVFVSDMARSIRFYCDVLELPIRFESWSGEEKGFVPANDAGFARDSTPFAARAQPE